MMPINLALTTLQVRTLEGDVREADLTSASPGLFETAVPWRQFRWYRGQRHYSGSYWCATSASMVGYESRLELANLLSEDFDPQTSWILSQPLLMSGMDGKRARRHIPDYLVERPDGSLCIIDVKPAAMMDDQRVAESLQWSREVIGACGWEYRVQAEPENIRLANIRFLAGYRRPFQFVPVELQAVASAIDGPMTIRGAAATASAVVGDDARARGFVFHLLWNGTLHADLSRPLQHDSLVEHAP